MYQALLIFAILVVAAMILAAVDSGELFLKEENYFIKNGSILLGSGFSLIGATISWGIFIVLGVINLTPRIVAAFNAFL